MRALCGRALPFFNHYLDMYWSYLIQQRQAANAEQRQWAEERLSEMEGK